MTSIDIETLLTIIFVHVDDWYKEKGQQLLRGKVGCKPDFRDSEVIHHLDDCRGLHSVSG